MEEDILLVAKYDFQATDVRELTILKGDKLRLLDGSQHWWHVMSEQGHIGYVPSNYVKKTKQGIFSSLRNTLGRTKKYGGKGEKNAGYSALMNSTGVISAVNSVNTNTAPSSVLPIVNSIATSHSQSFTVGSALQNLVLANGDCTDASAANRNRSHTDEMNVKLSTMHIEKSDQLFPNGGALSTVGGCNNAERVSVHCAKEADVVAGGGIGAGSVHASASNAVAAVAGLEKSNVENDDIIQTKEYFVVKFEYGAQKPDELTLVPGDTLLVMQKCSDSWWFGRCIARTSTCMDSPVNEGWFPSNFVVPAPLKTTRMDSSGKTVNLDATGVQQQHHISATIDGDGSNQDDLHSISGNLTFSKPESIRSFIKSANDAIAIVRTLYPFSRSHNFELSFEANEILHIISKPADDPEWWMARNSRNEQGLVPVNYISVQQDFTKNMRQPVLSGEDLRRNYNPSGPFANEKWYWSLICRTDCEMMLAQYAKRGQYLVRDSETNPGNYTVSMFTGKRCRHFKVIVANSNFTIGQKSFADMHSLLEHYKISPVYKSDDEVQYLTSAFIHPGSSPL